MSVQTRVARLALVFAGAAALAVGCTEWPEAPAIRRLAADATRVGDQGDAGPHGVGCQRLRRQVHVSDGVSLHVCWPIAADGSLAAGGPFPGVAILAGGLVEPSRYDWLATHLVSRGAVVVVPEFTFNLSILDLEPAFAAMQLLRDAASAETSTGILAGAVRLDNGLAVIGHSLGGVVATRVWLDEADVGALVLLASYPDAADDVAARAGDPVLSLGGSNDRVALASDVRAGFERFAPPRWLAMVDGMHHAAWTDSVPDDELDGDGVPARPVDDMRRDALRLLDAFVDAHVAGQAAGWAKLNDGVFPRLTVSR